MPRCIPKLSLSVKIDADIVLAARRLARDYSGKPEYLRLNLIVENSLRRFIEEFEKMHGDAGGGAEAVRDRPSRNSQPKH